MKIKAECSECGHKGEIGFTDVFSDAGLERLSAWYEAFSHATDTHVTPQDVMLVVEIRDEIEARAKTGQPASERRL